MFIIFNAKKKNNNKSKKKEKKKKKKKSRKKQTKQKLWFLSNSVKENRVVTLRTFQDV